MYKFSSYLALILRITTFLPELGSIGTKAARHHLHHSSAFLVVGALLREHQAAPPVPAGGRRHVVRAVGKRPAFLGGYGTVQEVRRSGTGTALVDDSPALGPHEPHLDRGCDRRVAGPDLNVVRGRNARGGVVADPLRPRRRRRRTVRPKGGLDARGRLHRRQ